MARLNYVELPTRDIAATRSFYESVFGWTLAQFGPTYAATTTGDTDIGLQADANEATKAPLPVIEVDDLERALEAVISAGGTVTQPIFDFPGGRRFQFLDPSGNEIAAVKPGWQPARSISRRNAKRETSPHPLSGIIPSGGGRGSGETA
jgi:predicted enzyme related to lactoylglutathione lyase